MQRNNRTTYERKILLNSIPIISLTSIPKCPIGNKSAMIRVMAWRRVGDKSLPETTMTGLITMS